MLCGGTAGREQVIPDGLTGTGAGTGTERNVTCSLVAAAAPVACCHARPRHLVIAEDYRQNNGVFAVMASRVKSAGLPSPPQPYNDTTNLRIEPAC